MKENCLIILAKFLKFVFQLLTGLQFDIFYVIKTRVGFEIAEIARFLLARFQRLQRLQDSKLQRLQDFYFKYARHNHLPCPMMGEVSLET